MYVKIVGWDRHHSQNSYWTFDTGQGPFMEVKYNLFCVPVSYCQFIVKQSYLQHQLHKLAYLFSIVSLQSKKVITHEYI
jgi:hypothetical protein